MAHKIIEWPRWWRIAINSDGNRMCDGQESKIATYAMDATKIDCPAGGGRERNIVVVSAQKLKSSTLPPANSKGNAS